MIKAVVLLPRRADMSQLLLLVVEEQDILLPTGAAASAG
jgi:hypothetical protein